MTNVIVWPSPDERALREARYYFKRLNECDESIVDEWDRWMEERCHRAIFNALVEREYELPTGSLDNPDAVQTETA